MAIDFRLRDFAYPLTIVSLRRQLERSQWLPPDELRHEQDQRLRQTIAHAYAQVPFYRRLLDERGLRPTDFESAQDLSRLPVLDKATVRDQASNFHARNSWKHLPKPHQTSGTTGSPLSFLLDKRSNSLEFAYYWRHWSWLGFRLGDPVGELGTKHFLTRPALVDREFHWQAPLRRLMLNANRLQADSVRVMVSALRARRVRFLKGLASALYFFAQCVEEAGESLPLQGVFSTGEKLTPAFRRRIESVLGCRVLDSYGHMERTVAIAECPQGGYHVNDDYGVLELLDPSPDPSPSSPPGTTIARAVGTSLYNRAMPLIRYDIGDHIELRPSCSPCPCGRTLPLVQGVRGRAQDVVVTPDGRVATALFILPELVEGVGFAQFLQERRNRLEVRVVPSIGWNERQQQALLGHLHHALGDSIEVELALIDPKDVVQDPSGKRPVVVSAVTAD